MINRIFVLFAVWPDMKLILFLYLLNNLKIDRTKVGFENHIQFDHHLWNYLFYMYHLKKKEETDYTGIESYIAEKV